MGTKSENITIGSLIEVKNSICHEASGIELKGARAVIRQYYESDTPEEPDEVLLEWTPETLDAFPENFFLDSFDQELSWTVYVLPVNMLQIVDTPFDEIKLAWKKHDIFTRLFQSEFGREGRAAAKAFEKPVDRNTKTPLECWYDYLSQCMTWPVKCEICYPYDEEDGPLHEGDKVLLKGLNGIDRSLGILVETEAGGKEYILPLQDINGTDQVSKNARYINAYGLWLICTA